ncbi:MAG: hypothetical protein RJB13_2191 [Pseudomonadota bacterium]
MGTQRNTNCFENFRWIITFAIGCFLVLSQNLSIVQSTALATELNVESSLDQSPAELKKLNESAKLLEKRFAELEQRLLAEQSKIAKNSTAELVELSLSLAPQFESESKKQNDSILVSHLRMSLNGRPHIFNQDALLVSSEFPIPLYLGLIKTGKHLVKIQFQASHYQGPDESAMQRSWIKVDETFTLNLDSSESRKLVRNVFITPSQGKLTVGLQKAVE